MIAGGGTGGHVIPALAIGRELRDAAGAEVRFVGTERGLETRLIPEAGFPLEMIHVGQLKNVSLRTRLKTLTDLPRGLLRCVSLLCSYKPHVVIGVGGYASGPGMMAAILLGVPTLAFEPNAVPGLANRLVGIFVTAAAVNFATSRKFFRGAQVTGIPVRCAFFDIQPKPEGAAPRLLIFGGSQGARVLNDVMPKLVVRLLAGFPELTIVHQTGPHGELATREAYTASGADATQWQVSAYLDDMPHHFAEANLILCRSGASTMAELGAAGKPSILIPFPRAADDHQRKNAEVFAEAGAAVMVLESAMEPQMLFTHLRNLLSNPTQLHRMGTRARALAQPDALQVIGRMAVKIARKP